MSLNIHIASFYFMSTINLSIAIIVAAAWTCNFLQKGPCSAVYFIVMLTWDDRNES